MVDTAIARRGLVPKESGLQLLSSLAHQKGAHHSSQPAILESHQQANGTMDVAQLRVSSPSMHKALGLISLALHKQGMATCL